MPAPGGDDAGLERRIARARKLIDEHPAAAAILGFYIELVEFQRSTLGGDWPTTASRPFDASLDRIVGAAPGFLSWVERRGPPALAEAAADLRRLSYDEWRSLIGSYWDADAHDRPELDEGALFVVEALLQPFAEELGRARTGDRTRGREAVAPAAPARCPACTGEPVVGVLREEGQSARRSLVCGLCLTEWAWPRLICPACGENGFEALPVFRSDAFPAVRVDACDSCRTYLKTIDLARDGRAVPVVDELASVPLDLWAQGEGYRKLRPNLLRM